MPLSLVLNGQTRSFPNLESGAGIDRLVTELALKFDRVAVERNGEIVSRARWPSVGLQEGDKLEVVHFVGGGLV